MTSFRGGPYDLYLTTKQVYQFVHRLVLSLLLQCIGKTVNNCISEQKVLFAVVRDNG